MLVASSRFSLPLINKSSTIGRAKVNKPKVAGITKIDIVERASLVEILSPLKSLKLPYLAICGYTAVIMEVTTIPVTNDWSL